MKEKNTMKLWQMLSLAVICVGLLVNMFLPLWNANGTKIMDWMLDSVSENPEQAGSLFSSLSEMNISKEELRIALGKLEEGDPDTKRKLEESIDDIDDNLEKIEDKLGINLFSMSGFDLITMDVNAFLLGDKNYTEEELDEFEQKFEKEERESEKVTADSLEEIRGKIISGKIVCMTMYVCTGIVLLLIFLGFFLGWNKLIVSISSSVLGAGIMCYHGWMWWATPNYAVGQMEEGDMVLPYIQSFWGSIVSIGIIAGFILGALFLLMALTTCFVGRPEVIPEPEPLPEPNPFPFPEPFPEPNPFPFPEPFPEPKPFPNPTPFPQPVPPPPVPVPPKSGRVKCTQGVAVGQGYKLPEDRKVIVGKSPQNATLVIHDQHVSNIHCSIRYRAETDTYIVKDHSTNGTFVHGVRLGKDVAVEYPSGTVLSLADGTNKITLG